MLGPVAVEDSGLDLGDALLVVGTSAADHLQVNGDRIVDENDVARTVSYTSDVTGVGIEAVLIETGGGNDVVNVQSIAVPTTVDLGTGADTLNVGSLAPNPGGTLSLVVATLNVVGDGADTLVVDATGDGRDLAGVMSETSITGFGMAGRIDYAGLASLEVNLGEGVNEVLVDSTHVGWTTIDTGAGDDRVRLHSTAGPTVVYTGADSDVVTIADADLTSP